MYSILDRIRKIISDLNLSDSAFAKSLDIPQATFSNMFLRQSEPKPSWLQAIVKKYNVSPDWLLTGEGEMFRTQEKNEICVTEDRKIPILNQSVSCGPGQEWQEADIRPKDCYAFRVRGTSMVGLGIDDGDMVILNRDMQDLNDDIYVFALDGAVYCKLLKFDSITQKIRIYSVHTKELKDAELLKVIDTTNPDITEYFHIFGRVLGWVRENTLMRR